MTLYINLRDDFYSPMNVAYIANGLANASTSIKNE